MKAALLFCIIATAYLASAVPVDDGFPQKTYSRYIEFPDGEGNMHTVDLEEELDTELLAEIERNPANNVYHLYTRRNRLVAQTLSMNNANSIRNSNFNPNVPTKVIVHGWLSTRLTEPNPTLRRAWLDKSDVNVIAVDWSRLASSGYATAASGVPNIGVGVGQFLQFLSTTTGAAFTNMHLAGFSLGAHVVGNAGRQLGGRVARVTGLDPAGPLWTLSSSQRLRPTDGVYVEAIHTDGGVGGLGIGSAIARADFFPNGGNSQPGCLLSLCNHNRAWELFGATITRDHLVGRQCSTSLQISLNTCTGSQFRLGNDDLRKFGTGMYRVNTNRSYPF